MIRLSCSCRILHNYKEKSLFSGLRTESRRAEKKLPGSSLLYRGLRDAKTEIMQINAEDEEAPLVEGVNSKRQQVDYARAIALFLIPALGGFLFGYDIGATSGAVDGIQSVSKSGTDWYNISSFQEGLAVSTGLLGAMAGSIAAFSFGSRVGRRTEMRGAAILYGIGTSVMTTAGGYVPLCIGRLVYGLGIGLAMHGAPGYISETAPANLRGLFISLKEALIVFGILSGYFVSFAFVDKVGGWRWMYSLSLPVILAYAIGLCFIPESPRFLILNGKLNEAKAAMRSVCGKIDNIDSVIDSEVGTISAVDRGDDGQNEANILDPKYSRPLFITLSLVVLQQATGQPSVLYYAQEILEKAGLFSDDSDASGGAVAIGVWKLTMTLLAASRVESSGRRTLLLYGSTALTVALVTLSLTTWLGNTMIEGSLIDGAAVLALVLYVGAYQFSFGPVVWTLVGELYPLEVRTQGIAMCTFTNFGVNFIVGLIFPVLSDTIGLSIEYLLFAAIGVLSIATIYLYVPETKGKSLEELEELMQS